jgi:hypothetical protein
MNIPMYPQVDAHSPISIRRQLTRLAFLLLVIVVWTGACAPVPSRAPAPAPERRTVAEVLERVGAAAESRLKPLFERARVPYPPGKVYLLAFKEERRLELWAESSNGPAFVRAYRILRASGGTGPKLRAGDWQIPEGIYQVTGLNPNSRFYLSLKLNYPNDFDRLKARKDGRSDLGGDIFIHGNDPSRGCIGVGNPDIEELFALAVRTGPSNTEVIIAPHDLREKPPPRFTKTASPWLPELYARLREGLARFEARASGVR